MHEAGNRPYQLGLEDIPASHDPVASEFENTLRLHGITIRGQLTPDYFGILTPGALRFVANLNEQFAGRRDAVLQEREVRMAEVRKGKQPGFLPESAHVRTSSWKVPSSPLSAGAPRIAVSIAPFDRRMFICSLNAGADAVIADFDDAQPPTWENVIHGLLNLRDAARGSIYFADPNARNSIADSSAATVILRPRAMSWVEKHLLIRGIPVPASLLDFGLYVYHASSTLAGKGSGLHFCLSDVQNHLDARLWNDILAYAESQMGLPAGTFRATMVVESLPAVFELDEIIFELRDHADGVYYDRTGFLFNQMQMLAARPEPLPSNQRGAAAHETVASPVSALLARTCLRRAISALAGPIAAAPMQPAALERAGREARDYLGSGFGGIVVLHPDLISTVRSGFARMPTQAEILTDENGDAASLSSGLLRMPDDLPSERDIRSMLRSAIIALAAWLRGQSPLSLRDDILASSGVRLSIARLWRWQREKTPLDTIPRKVTPNLIHRLLKEEMHDLQTEMGDEECERGKFRLARSIVRDHLTHPSLPDFPQSRWYEHLGG